MHINLVTDTPQVKYSERHYRQFTTPWSWSDLTKKTSTNVPIATTTTTITTFTTTTTTTNTITTTLISPGGGNHSQTCPPKCPGGTLQPGNPISSETSNGVNRNSIDHSIEFDDPEPGSNTAENTTLQRQQIANATSPAPTSGPNTTAAPSSEETVEFYLSEEARECKLTSK